MGVHEPVVGIILREPLERKFFLFSHMKGVEEGNNLRRLDRERERERDRRKEGKGRREKVGMYDLNDEYGSITWLS